MKCGKLTGKKWWETMHNVIEIQIHDKFKNMMTGAISWTAGSKACVHKREK
jgi:hypothetical protein